MFPPCGAGKQVGCICSVSLKTERSIRGNGRSEFAPCGDSDPPRGIKEWHGN